MTDLHSTLDDSTPDGTKAGACDDEHRVIYCQRQTGPLWMLLVFVGLASWGGAFGVWQWGAPNLHAVVIVLLLAGVLEVVLATAFRSLTITVYRVAVTAQYGPLPLFRKVILLEEIVRVETARSSVADGWGIHWFPGRGWTYNLWGFDCVLLTLKNGSTVRFGTEEPSQLVEAIVAAAPRN
ncbi:MAG: hypothetical protein R3C01_05185 [Planctomycetaceae bacterium]